MNKKIWIFIFCVLFCTLMFSNLYLKQKGQEKVVNQIMENQTKELSRQTAEVIQVTSSNFENIVLNNPKNVVVDFYADWCQPCKAMSLVIDEVASENKNEDLVFVRLNIDDEEKIADLYGIQYIPTLVFIKDGKEVDRITGYVEKEDLIEFANRGKL